MKLADKGLNTQAQAIENAQTRIRLAVRDGWLSGKPKSVINIEVQRIIHDELQHVTLSDLRSAAYRSLNAFAERQYSTYLREFGIGSAYLSALIVLVGTAQNTARFASALRTVEHYAPATLGTSERGVPLQEYARDYFNERVAPVLDRMASENALDPDDVSGRNSLRNRAEMEVRYARHLDEIESLRAAGVKLVTSSVHADCSDRCYKWQGRVYSLDGTSGTTDDGKPYVPIETATDVYYTTKAGKTYKNGLFGFNCRHYLVTYKSGMTIPHVSKAEQKREQQINTRQRELERRVREQRERALMYNDIDRERYLKARERAIQANKQYIRFSQENGRAYYPSRVKLL